ncbi:MAG: ATP-binding protein [Chloroflexi bacterium]|nr:MAG: ATP-binding protein [Chloroflexota bacterium]
MRLIHPMYAAAKMLRPRDRTLATPYFPVGGPVPAADLVGREMYLRRLTERLEDGQHVLISGPRRIGKTSIIIEALRRLRRRGAYTAYVDCLGATDIRGLGERLADAVLQNLSGVERSFEQAKAIAAGMQPTVKVKYEHVELALQLARETNAPRFFEGALDLAQGLAKRSGKRVVVVLDEFQAAGRLGPRVFDVMRTRFQAHRGVSYAFLGSEQGILEELFSAKGHAFYRFAVPLDLTDAGGHRFGIDPDDWLEYLKAKFAAKKLAIDDASVDRLLDATGGHPQDTMQVCAALYYLMRDAGSRSVTPDLLEVAYEQAMRELERPFALHWTELGSHKYLQQVAKRIAHRAVLYAAEADGGAVPRPEVLRALAALQERGLAVRLGRGRYDFVEPMFGEYVRRLDEGLMTGTVPTR